MDPIEFVIGNGQNSLQLLHQNSLNDADRLLQQQHSGEKLSEKTTELKQAFSRLSTMYCMLPEYFHANSFKPLNLETLALKWMDPSYDVSSLRFILYYEMKEFLNQINLFSKF